MNRIPGFGATCPDGMPAWFAEIAKRDLLFHSDDDPGDIVCVADGAALGGVLAGILAPHRDGVHGAWHAILMRASGLRLEAR